MMRVLKFPLNIQTFADEPGDNGDPNQTETGPSYTQAQLEEIASARADRASNAALKDFFKKQGLEESEINNALQTYKANKEAEAPDIAKITNQLTSAQTEALQAKLENKAILQMIDLDVDIKQMPYILKLADIKMVDGEVKDEDIKEAIKKVLDDVPAFKSHQDQDQGKGFKFGADIKKQKATEDEEMAAWRKQAGL